MGPVFSVLLKFCPKSGEAPVALPHAPTGSGPSYVALAWKALFRGLKSVVIAPPSGGLSRAALSEGDGTLDAAGTSRTGSVCEIARGL